jgi:hypothetical protein
MKSHVLTLFLLFMFSMTSLQAQSNPKTPSDPGALPAVIQQVTGALQEYQDSRGSGPDALPPLAQAQFDFKTTIKTSGGFTLNLFVFKFGTTHENDQTNDVEFTYALPKPKSMRSMTSQAPSTQLKDVLAQTIQSAALSVKNGGKVAGLPLNSLKVTLSFAVDWNVDGGGQVTYSIVTAGLNASKDKNSIQTVVLTFAQ